MENKHKFLRVSALLHYAIGTGMVKVIFRKGGWQTVKEMQDQGMETAEEKAYWMKPETYDAIPLGVDATIEDYQKHGELVEAVNTDIYDIEKN